MAASPWIGKWELTSSENYDEYLKAAGVGMIKRKLAQSVNPVLVISEADGKITIRTETTLKNLEISFTPGIEFDEVLADDRKAKSLVTIDGNKLVLKQRVDGFEAVTVREFNEKEMIVTFTTGGVVATRKFKRVA